MKKLWLAFPILALVPQLFAQELSKAISAAPDKFDLSKSSIKWRKGLEPALNQGKPILLFQLLGNFDDVYC